MLPYLRSSGTKYNGDGPAGTCNLQRGPIKSAKPEAKIIPESEAFIDLPALVRSFAWPPRASTLLIGIENRFSRQRRNRIAAAVSFFLLLFLSLERAVEMWKIRRPTGSGYE